MSLELVTAIDVASLPDYPEELCDPALTADFFTKFWHDRWLASKLHLTANLSVQGAALNLYFLSRKQVPVGSLPIEHEMLASLLRIGNDEWRGLMAQTVTPLHKWKHYAYGDEVVYGHAVVIEVALDALGRREARRASTAAKAVSVRQARLVDVMKDIGCDRVVCSDKALIERLDEWLVENHHGTRRRPQFDASVKRALRHAANQKWLAL